MIKIITKENSKISKSDNSICYNYFGDIASENQSELLFGSLVAFNLYFIQPKYTKVYPRKKNTEIITFPISGNLHHLNTVAINNLLVPSSIQRLTCGKGLSYTNENLSNSQTSFLEMEFFAKESNQLPSYEYFSFKLPENDKIKIASDSSNDKILFLNTRANFFIIAYDENKNILEDLDSESKYLYFILDGEIILNQEHLTEHTLIKLYKTNQIEIQTKSKSSILKIELPYLFI